MSNLDLKTLIGHGGAVRSPVAGSIVGPLIHTPNFQETQKQAIRKMDKLCEIMAPGKRSGGFGQTDAPHVILYSGACSIGQRQPQSESSTPGEATDANSEWEIAIPLDVSNVPNNARIASPGWFNEWRPSRAYAISRTEKGTFGERVIPTDLDTGAGLWFECVQEGNSGNVEPVWPNQIYSTVADGSVIWRCSGVVVFYNIVGNDEGQSHATETVFRCKVVE